MRWHFTARALVGVVAAFILAGQSQASVIVQTEGFTVAGNFAQLQFAEFDPALGSLDKVHVEISGLLTFSLRLGAGQTYAPVVLINAFGAPQSRGFDFSGPARLFLPATTYSPDGCGPTHYCGPARVPFAAAFSLSFDVGWLTDLSGVVIAETSHGLAPPPLVDTRRSNFIEGMVSLPIIEQLSFSSLGYSSPFYTGGGAAIVTYHYTPVMPGPGPMPDATVDGPAAIGLLMLALGALRLTSSRRRRDA